MLEPIIAIDTYRNVFQDAAHLVEPFVTSNGHKIKWQFTDQKMKKFVDKYFTLRNAYVAANRIHDNKIPCKVAAFNIAKAVLRLGSSYFLSCDAPNNLIVTDYFSRFVGFLAFGILCIDGKALAQHEYNKLLDAINAIAADGARPSELKKLEEGIDYLAETYGAKKQTIF